MMLRPVFGLLVLLMFGVYVAQSAAILGKVGIMQPDGSLDYVGGTLPGAAEVFTRYINSRGGYIGGTNIKPVLIFVQCGTTVAQAINATQYLIRQQVSVILAPPGPMTPTVAKTALPHGIMVLSGESLGPETTTKPDGTRRYPNLYSVLTPPKSYFNSLPSLVLYSAYQFTTAQRTAAVISLNGTTHVDVCIGGVIPLFTDYGIKVVYQQLLTYNGTENIPAEQREMAAAIQQLKILKPDVVVVCNRFACDRWQQLSYDYDYTPPALGMFECGSTLSTSVASVGDKVLYTMSPAQFDPRAKYDNDEAAWDPLRPFCNAFPRADNSVPHSGAQWANAYNALPIAQQYPLVAGTATAMASLYVFEYCAHFCNNTSPACFLDQVSKMNVPSFFGQLAFNLDGNNDAKGMVATQVLPSFATTTSTPSVDMYAVDTTTPSGDIQPGNITNQICAPLVSQTSQFQYPMPTWQERVYIHRMFALPEEIAVAVLVGVCCAVAVFAMVFMFGHRNLGNIKAYSLNFSMVQLFGCILSFVSVLMWPVENSSVTCNARLPMLALGFILFETPVPAKTRRIYRVLSMGKASGKTIAKDQKLGLRLGESESRGSLKRAARYCGQLCCNDAPKLSAKDTDSDVLRDMLVYAAVIAIPVCLWMIIDPLEATVHVTDPFRPVYNYTVCSSSSNIFAYWTFAAVTFVMLVSLYQAWRIRDLDEQYSQFRDAPQIVDSTYLLAFLLFVIVLVQFTLSGSDTSLGQQRVLFLIRAMYIVAIASSAAALFFRRLWKSRSEKCAELCPCGYKRSVGKGSKGKEPQGSQDSTGSHTKNNSSSLSQSNHRSTVSGSVASNTKYHQSGQATPASREFEPRESDVLNSGAVAQHHDKETSFSLGSLSVPDSPVPASAAFDALLPLSAGSLSLSPPVQSPSNDSSDGDALPPPAPIAASAAALVESAIPITAFNEDRCKSHSIELVISVSPPSQGQGSCSSTSTSDE